MQLFSNLCALAFSLSLSLPVCFSLFLSVSILYARRMRFRSVQVNFLLSLAFTVSVFVRSNVKL